MISLLLGCWQSNVQHGKASIRQDQQSWMLTGGELGKLANPPLVLF